MPDFSSWAASASALDVDVLAVQEVDNLLERSGRVDQVAELRATLAQSGQAWTARFAAAVQGTPGSRGTMRPAESTMREEPSYGVALLSRYPVTEWRELRMGPSPWARLPVPLPPTAPQRILWVPDEQRVAVAGLIATPGGVVSAVCTHLSFAPSRAVVQLRQVATWARSLPRPLVLLGDLNLPGRLPRLITGWEPLVKAATYPVPRPRMQLDHVLLDAGKARLHLETAEARIVGKSDHLALRVELAMGRNGP